jgi:GDPmannose 4,6-dehydratase
MASTLSNVIYLLKVFLIFMKLRTPGHLPLMHAALITGVAGQDGSYLAELLLSKGYIVYGLTRYCSEKKHERIAHLKSNPYFHVIEGDLTDTARLSAIINSFEQFEHLEVYNLGAQSHVKVSFDQPEYTANVDALGTLRILEAIHKSGFSNKIRFYQAGTSEMFGASDPPQNELTAFWPRSPYGVAKVFAYWITRNYRESYGLYACTGILFNHESERRGEDFVTRKVTLGLAKYLKDGTPLELGNLDSRRDWGHAQDYVEAMWLMLQRDKAEDFVIGTGRTHTIREFIREASKAAGLRLIWRGTGQDEEGIDSTNGNVVISINPEFYRPAEVDFLQADPTRAKLVMGWEPKIEFSELARRMMENDIKNSGP